MAGLRKWRGVSANTTAVAGVWGMGGGGKRGLRAPRVLVNCKSRPPQFNSSGGVGSLRRGEQRRHLLWGPNVKRAPPRPLSSDSCSLPCPRKGTKKKRTKKKKTRRAPQKKAKTKRQRGSKERDRPLLYIVSLPLLFNPPHPSRFTPHQPSTHKILLSIYNHAHSADG